jgi:putative ABC transport system permease protein
MKSVGDTLYYQNGKGESVPVVIAGTYPTVLFHGNAIMSSEDFRRLWPKESGVEVLLVQSSRPDESIDILSTAMSEYGLHIQSVEERIRMFFEVTETYLIIFLTLGGLGLLLGIFSLIIIVRKNLTAQTSTIQQYRAMGFSEKLIGRLLLRENLLIPFYAICVGAIGSVISISANVGGAGWGTLLLALLCFMAICVLLYCGVKQIIIQYINNQTNNKQSL